MAESLVCFISLNFSPFSPQGTQIPFETPKKKAEIWLG